MKTESLLARFVIASACAVILCATPAWLIMAPPPRTPPGFSFPSEIRLASGIVLHGTAQERRGNDDLSLPESYRYRLADAMDAATSEMQIELFYLKGMSADARQLPENFAPRGILPPAGALRSLVKSNASESGAWLEAQAGGRFYFGARITPSGDSTVTKSELWQRRRSEWRRHPWPLLRCLFTSEMLVDRRALWLQMFTESSTGGLDEATQLEKVWRDVLTAVCGETRRGFRTRPATSGKQSESEN